jgi:hypothetical protein
VFFSSKQSTWIHVFEIEKNNKHLEKSYKNHMSYKATIFQCI